VSATYSVAKISGPGRMVQCSTPDPPPELGARVFIHDRSRSQDGTVRGAWGTVEWVEERRRRIRNLPATVLHVAGVLIDLY
jgi:hypothetical protein